MLRELFTRQPLADYLLAKKNQTLGLAFENGGPPRSRTGHQRIMRTTSVFTAPFRFVVWTVSYLSARPYSLYTFLDYSRLGSGLPRQSRGFPEFERFYQGAE